MLTTMKVDIYTCSCVLCSQNLQKQTKKIFKHGWRARCTGPGSAFVILKGYVWMDKPTGAKPALGPNCRKVYYSDLDKTSNA